MAISRTLRRPGRQKADKPNPIDVQVGSRVRLRRNMLGLSQEKLGEAIGLTFQQVQKYERGANRIGASRLHELSRVLDVPVSFFFDDIDPVRAPAIPAGFAEPPAEAFELRPAAPAARRSSWSTPISRSTTPRCGGACSISPRRLPPRASGRAKPAASSRRDGADANIALDARAVAFDKMPPAQGIGSQPHARPRRSV